MDKMLYGKPRIFIGSSARAYELVKWLAEQIRSHDFAVPIEWKSGGFAPSKSTLDNLLEQCRTCDFAVIFFTRDDDKFAKQLIDSNPTQIFKGPRDNTIFEAGLFVGALGLAPERCILVSTVLESTLPSDIRGVTYIPIDEPPPAEPPNNRIPEDWCMEHLQQVLQSVILSVKQYGELLNRPVLKVLTKSQLAERQQVGKNCLEKYDKVVITSSEPEECCDYILAKSVCRNIKKHVYYDYHFLFSNQNRENVASQWIDLIRILLAMILILDKEYTEGDLKKDSDINDIINGCMEKDEKAVDDAINTLKDQLRFFIHKDDQPFPVRVTVHNYSSNDKAVCYLRKNDYYVEWFNHNEAQMPIRLLGKLERVDDRVFQNSEKFKLFPEEYSQDCNCDEMKDALQTASENIDKTIIDRKEIDNMIHVLKTSKHKIACKMSLRDLKSKIKDVNEEKCTKIIINELKNLTKKIVNDFNQTKITYNEIRESVHKAFLVEKIIIEKSNKIIRTVNEKISDLKLNDIDKIKKAVENAYEQEIKTFSWFDTIEKLIDEEVKIRKKGLMNISEAKEFVKTALQKSNTSPLTVSEIKKVIDDAAGGRNEAIFSVNEINDLMEITIQSNNEKNTLINEIISLLLDQEKKSCISDDDLKNMIKNLEKSIISKVLKESVIQKITDVYCKQKCYMIDIHDVTILSNDMIKNTALQKSENQLHACSLTLLHNIDIQINKEFNTNIKISISDIERLFDNVSSSINEENQLPILFEITDFLKKQIQNEIDKQNYEKSKNDNLEGMKLRKILMEKITTLFSDYKLREKIRDLCFGVEDTKIKSEWRNLLLKTYGIKKDKNILSVIDSVSINYDNKRWEIVEKIKDIDDDTLIPVFLDSDRKNVVVSKKQLEEFICVYNDNYDGKHDGTINFDKLKTIIERCNIKQYRLIVPESMEIETAMEMLKSIPTEEEYLLVTKDGLESQPGIGCIQKSKLFEII
ncbi:MAG: nucleotide-binding protein [Chitinispirillaceae bacterium]|nr:nucleotide-binding protein [Chitinispirillaceae bacterium]